MEYTEKIMNMKKWSGKGQGERDKYEKFVQYNKAVTNETWNKDITEVNEENKTFKERINCY